MWSCNADANSVRVVHVDIGFCGILVTSVRILQYSKNCVKRPLSNHKLVFKTIYRLIEIKSIADSAILSTFIKLPFVIKIVVCLFLSGRFTQVLLYIQNIRTPMNKTMYGNIV